MIYCFVKLKLNFTFNSSFVFSLPKKAVGFTILNIAIVRSLVPSKDIVFISVLKNQFKVTISGLLTPDTVIVPTDSNTNLSPFTAVILFSMDL